MTNVELWKYIIDGNCDYFTLFLSEVHPLLQMGLRNPTKHNRVKSSTYVKHGNNETPTKNPSIPRGEHNRFGYTDF